jgi:NifU-like protein involved in Fe-S cluster formation
LIDDLYSARILALVADMPRTGRLAAPDAAAERTAKLCGSRIRVEVAVEDDRVVDFAQEVQACALGQAAAAVLGAHVVGATLAEIEMARDGLRAMLKDQGPPPQGRFSDLAVLQPVKDYPARHASSQLAFEAAAEAVRKAMAVRTERTSWALQAKV